MESFFLVLVFVILISHTFSHVQGRGYVNSAHAVSDHRGLAIISNAAGTDKDATDEIEERRLKARELLKIKNPSPTFNVQLTVGSVDGSKVSNNKARRSLRIIDASQTSNNDKGVKVFYHGNEIGFSVMSDKSAAIFLVDIDPEGYISIIFPANSEDNLFINKDENSNLVEPGKVGDPLGEETFKLFAFRKTPLELIRFAGRSPINPKSKEFEDLLNTVNMYTQPNGDWSESMVKIITKSR